MSKFFVCHEPQCTEVVLNPYRHHLEFHSFDLTDEAIVCLRKQASKRELQILKETKKSATPSCKRKTEQQTSHPQHQIPKSRKFGENFSQKVGKNKRTLDILSSNVSTSSSTQNNTEIRTGHKERGISSSSSAGPKWNVDITSSAPTFSNEVISPKKKTPKKTNQRLIATELSETKPNSVQKNNMILRQVQSLKEVVGRIGYKVRDQSCSSSVSSKRTAHKTFSNLTLSDDVIPPVNEKTTMKKKAEISNVYSCDNSNSQQETRKCMTSNDFVQQTLKNKIIKTSKSNKGKSPSSADKILSKSSKSKLCKISPVESLKEDESNMANQSTSEDLAYATDQRSSIAEIKKLSKSRKRKSQSSSHLTLNNSSKSKLCKIHHVELLKEDESNISNQSTSEDLADATDQRSIASVLSERRNYDAQKDHWILKTVIENETDSAVLVENGGIKQEPSSSVCYTLQNETNIELTHDIKSEVILGVEKDAPVLFTSPKTMDIRMSPPRLPTTLTHPSSTYTLNESGLSPSHVYGSLELSPHNTARSLERYPVLLASRLPILPSSRPAEPPPYITLNQPLIAAQCPAPSSNVFHNPSQLSTPSRDNRQAMPPPSNSAHLTQNLRGCIPSRSSNIHQSARLSSSNWNFSPEHLQRNLTSSKICGSGKTLLRGQLHSTTKINSPEKSKQKCSMTKLSDSSINLNKIRLPNSASQNQCLDIFSQSSVIPPKLITKELNNRNVTETRPIHQANEENCAEVTLNINLSNTFKLKPSHQRISCEQNENLQEPSPVHIKTENDRASPLPIYLNSTLYDRNEQLVPVETVGKDSENVSLPWNQTDSSLIAESRQIIDLCDEISDTSSKTLVSSILTDETPVSMSRDEVMYRFLVSQYAIRHLSSCIDSPTKIRHINHKEASEVQSVLMVLLFLKSGGDMALLCLITVFDLLGAQNIKGDFLLVHQSTGKSMMLSNSEQNYMKNFIKTVRPVLSTDSYGLLFTINSLPFTETFFRQALRYCWAKAQIGLDVSVLWKHGKQTSVKCESACDNEGAQNFDITSTSEFEDPVEVSPTDLSSQHC